MYHLLIYFVYCNMKTCTKCNIEKPYSDFHYQHNRKDKLTSQCSDCKKIYDKEYRKNNLQKKREADRNYYLNNKDKFKRYQEENKQNILINAKKYQKHKRSTDAFYRLKGDVRNRINIGIRFNGYKKSKRTIEYLGCSYNYYKDYLESMFKDGMSWDNRTEWHIDHIIPLASANTEEELIKLFHYTNTQPLWAEENLSKGSKIL